MHFALVGQIAEDLFLKYNLKAAAVYSTFSWLRSKHICDVHTTTCCAFPSRLALMKSVYVS
jgi:hypothetical protein